MKRLLPVLMGFVVLLGMQQAQAFDPEHLKRLKETNKCPYCDLQGADLQEREIWDLMGIHFEGHPNMKRVLLWEGFPGHPLRKDFLE